MWTRPSSAVGKEKASTAHSLGCGVVQPRGWLAWVRPFARALFVTSLLCAGGEPRIQPVALKSRRETDEALLLLHNRSGAEIRALWLDFEGNEVAYTGIQTGESKRYRTFVGHAWLMRDAATGRRCLCNGASAVVGGNDMLEVEVTECPALPWTVDNHRHFDPAFKAEACSLLLAHHHLRCGDVYVDAPEDLPGEEESDCPVPVELGLGDLPPELLVDVISHLAPAQTQDPDLGHGRCPSLEPVSLAYDPFDEPPAAAAPAVPQSPMVMGGAPLQLPLDLQPFDLDFFE